MKQIGTLLTRGRKRGVYITKRNGDRYVTFHNGYTVDCVFPGDTTFVAPGKRGIDYANRLLTSTYGDNYWTRG